MALMYCRECGKQVSSEAPVCPHCGIRHPVHQFERQPLPMRRMRPSFSMQKKHYDTTVAVLLSVFFPGVGQMYKGEVGLGAVLLIGTFIGYASCFFPGLILHIFSIVNAGERAV